MFSMFIISGTFITRSIVDSNNPLFARHFFFRFHLSFSQSSDNPRNSSRKPFIHNHGSWMHSSFVVFIACTPSVVSARSK